jgi:hypothetical protein
MIQKEPVKNKNKWKNRWNRNPLVKFLKSLFKVEIVKPKEPLKLPLAGRSKNFWRCSNKYAISALKAV